MLRVVLMAAALVAGGALPPRAAQDESVPLARVNGHVITGADVERHLRLGGAEPEEAALPVAEREELAAGRRRRALRELVERRLLYDAAREEYLSALAADDALERVAGEELRKLERRVGSRLEARWLLAEAGLTVEQYKEVQLQNLLAAKLLWDKVDSRVRVGPAEVRRYYEEHLDQFTRPPAAVYRQVLLVVAEGDDDAAVRAEAEWLLEQVRDGADMAQIADGASADRDRYPGGLHVVELPEGSGWLPPAVRGLEPGGPAQLRRVAGGWAIVRLEEVRPAGAVPFEQAQADIRQRLLRRRRAAARAEFIAALEAQGRVEYLAAAQELGQP